MINIEDFWAKTDKDKNPGITPEIHCFTVKIIGEQLYDLRYPEDSYQRAKKIPKSFKSVIAFICITHDVGKYYLGFQLMCEAWAKKHFPAFSAIKNEGKWLIYKDGSFQYTAQYHTAVTAHSVYAYMKKEGFDSRSSFNYSISSGYHHGYPKDNFASSGDDLILVEPTDSFDDIRQQYLKTRAPLLNLPVINDTFNFMEFLNESFNLKLPTNIPFKPITNAILKKEYEKKRALILANGMLVIADWLASDEKYHSMDKRALSIPFLEKEIKHQLEQIGFGLPKIKPNLSFCEIFPKIDKIRDLQLKTMQAITCAGTYVIEAPMGEGKTEAALFAAYRLMEKGENTGVYFALPSQATSNNMYERMKSFVNAICVEKNNTLLIHQMSWLEETMRIPDTNDPDSWFLSNRRALLSAFGIGTIDQALMSVIASKHYSVRRLGLAGKVIIIDEVHSYDTYTGTLIEKLCEECKELGCTIIILSATLQKKSRDKFIHVRQKKNPYPIISGITAKNKKIFVPAKHSRSQTVSILHATAEDSYAKAIAQARSGASVVWICNTVDSAQETCAHFASIAPDITLGIMQAREPYYRRKVKEDCWMKKLGKNSSTRGGCILVSTQVIEQSVDIDADSMYSEIAPVDFIFQRMGRLWRHDIKDRPVSSCEFTIIENIPEKPFYEMTRKEIETFYKPSSNFYDAYILMKSQIALSKITTISLPEDVRPIIESVYKECPNEPTGWEQLKAASIERNEKLLSKAKSIVTIYGTELIGEEDITTRANEILYENVILVTKITDSSITFLNGDVVQIDKFEEKINITTKRIFAKNAVRIPSYYFVNKEKRVDNWFVKRYSYGGIVGVVNSKGFIHSPDLTASLFYSDALGVEINNTRGASL